MKFRKDKQASPLAAAEKRDGPAPEEKSKSVPNPPHTTTGWLTSPKFGSAGSGGAELEPGLDKD